MTGAQGTGARTKSRPGSLPSPLTKHGRTRSQSFFDHVLQQISHAIAVAPFVVVPAHQLEEALVQFDPGAFVENRGSRAVNEIRADDFVFREFEEALEITLAGFLHRRRDFLVAG